MRTQTTLDANGSWEISISAGVTSVVAKNSSNRNVMQYYTSRLFACYASATQKAVCLYKEVVLGSLESVEFDVVQELFETYYNKGFYTRKTKIYVDTNNSIVLANLQQFFHASKGEIGRVSLAKDTFFVGDKLTFADGHGYGTHYNGVAGGQLTGIGTNGEISYIHSTLPGMETYYCTLNDFYLGTHRSAHTKDQALDLSGSWYYDPDNKQYVNSSNDVINAFILFTAPTWLPLKEEVLQYFDFEKVTVKEEDGKLYMRLWVLGDEGKLTNEVETNLFSQAIITLNEVEATTLAVFEFGENGDEVHSNGSNKAASEYSETNNDYKLTLSNLASVYTGARDAQGNSCIKLGTTTANGTFTFVVPEEVTQVNVYVAGYKDNDGKVTINGQEYDLDKYSDNGEYVVINVDTTNVKEVVVASKTSGERRCMINRIQYIGIPQ